ncbi:hypothetical protein TNCT_234521 [Trichonephila clavata]|uniref:Uncharacterized protein n=1 Tax=Trichonephila clavata TaxID=2740835 RepID=A0A8X6LAJ8_TRICU|nr:hypothetical protein TNCT_234521 [Trichonephila clavata]
MQLHRSPSSNRKPHSTVSIKPGTIRRAAFLKASASEKRIRFQLLRAFPRNATDSESRVLLFSISLSFISFGRKAFHWRQTTINSGAREKKEDNQQEVRTC